MRYIRNPGEPVYDVALRRYLTTPKDQVAQPETKHVFTDAYRANKWSSPETRSGPGSEVGKTRSVQAHLSSLLRDLHICSLLDAPCGDFNWMKETDLDEITYIGADIVDELIDGNIEHHAGPGRRFTVLDITQDPLPTVDLILCRDGLVHLADAAALRAVRNFKASGASYLLATSFTDTPENPDILTGWWRPLNLRLAPFNFPHPIVEIPDRDSDDLYGDKILGLWHLQELHDP